MNHTRCRCLLVLAVAVLPAQQPPRGAAKHPFEARSPSAIKYTVEGHAEAVEITNVRYEIVGAGIPGRAKDERLVLRETIRTKEVVDEKGMEASTLIEAWPLGVDLKEKPTYSLAVTGIDPRTRNGDILQVSRGLEDVEWWSVYKLGSGEHLLDTYVPLLDFSVGEKRRYAGLEVPPDNSTDARLTAPNVVAVLTYASPERVIREALITCEDAEARTFASFLLRFDSHDGVYRPRHPDFDQRELPIAAGHHCHHRSDCGRRP